MNKDTFQHHSVGIYRDDGLAVVKGLAGPEIERIKKRVIKIIKVCGLKKVNLKIVNFLDVTFNKKYNPYRKLEKQPVYINVNSNHPPTTVRELPESIAKRLSDLWCNKEILKKTIPS